MLTGVHEHRDDTGHVVQTVSAASRVVSLVPSLTEAIEVTAPGLVVGATDWCTHPADLDVTRIGGTKNPAVDAITDLGPDLVVANAEENRAVDIDRLRESGITVWVTAPTTVPEALHSLRAMLSVLRLDMPGWLTTAAEVWSDGVPVPRCRAVVPIWRRPWMALGRGTFAGDVLSRLGVANVLDDHAQRYPRIDVGQLPAHNLVVLPDEPYAFGPDDGPEAFPGVPAACVSGRHLTWYGPSLGEAREVLGAQLRPVCRSAD